uniref:Uncharacterized protein n=1 Tax=Hyaloperonospora arabidopsidis (strain Emoy2) TaxID=559515 RepID=M4BXT1_HYAAE
MGLLIDRCASIEAVGVGLVTKPEFQVTVVCRKVGRRRPFGKEERDLMQRTPMVWKMNNMRRYLRAARTLYERQCRMKRPSAILKMKPNLVRGWKVMRQCFKMDNSL